MLYYTIRLSIVKRCNQTQPVSFRIVPPCFVSPWRVFIGKRANFSATRQSLPCCTATIRPPWRSSWWCGGGGLTSRIADVHLPYFSVMSSHLMSSGQLHIMMLIQLVTEPPVIQQPGTPGYHKSIGHHFHRFALHLSAGQGGATVKNIAKGFTRVELKHIFIHLKSLPKEQAKDSGPIVYFIYRTLRLNLHMQTHAHNKCIYIYLHTCYAICTYIYNIIILYDLCLHTCTRVLQWIDVFAIHLLPRCRVNNELMNWSIKTTNDQFILFTDGSLWTVKPWASRRPVHQSQSLCSWRLVQCWCLPTGRGRYRVQIQGWVRLIFRKGSWRKVLWQLELSFL